MTLLAFLAFLASQRRVPPALGRARRFLCLSARTRPCNPHRNPSKKYQNGWGRSLPRSHFSLGGCPIPRSVKHSRGVLGTKRETRDEMRPLARQPCIWSLAIHGADLEYEGNSIILDLLPRGNSTVCGSQLHLGLSGRSEYERQVI